VIGEVWVFWLADWTWLSGGLCLMARARACVSGQVLQHHGPREARQRRGPAAHMMPATKLYRDQCIIEGKPKEVAHSICHRLVTLFVFQIGAYGWLTVQVLPSCLRAG
jgi:hypothetical protein